MREVGPRNEDMLTQQLRAWGFATVNRYCLSRSDRAVHALQAARDLAPGTKERALRELVGRDGRERRRFMAARSGVKGLQILPTWAVDPVRSSNDAARPGDLAEIAVDQGIPEELMWIDRALVAMARTHRLREKIVRTEFTEGGSQSSKTARVAEWYGGSLTLRQYRYELQQAKESLRLLRVMKTAA